VEIQPKYSLDFTNLGAMPNTNYITTLWQPELIDA